jgi:hypothetical protein
MTLHITKRIWPMRKKKKKYLCPKAWEKEKKDSPYLKIKDRVMHTSSIQKKFHTHAHLDLIV